MPVALMRAHGRKRGNIVSWTADLASELNKEEAFQVPNLCARCGVNPREAIYSVSQTREKCGLGGRYKVTTDYNVALCKECEAAVNRRERNGKIVSAIGLLLGIPAVIALIVSQGSNPGAAGFGTSPLAIGLGATFAVGILIAFAGQKFGKPRFGDYNGKYFRFRNKAYHEAFGKLNPAFVKPTRR
jgi:hypothetical protein